jgi:hypothetical protein
MRALEWRTSNGRQKRGNFKLESSGTRLFIEIKTKWVAGVAWPGKFPLICIICTVIKKQNGRCEQQPISAASALKSNLTDRGTKFAVKNTQKMPVATDF